MNEKYLEAKKLLEHLTKGQIINFVCKGLLTPLRYPTLEVRNGMLRVNDGSCPWEPGWRKIDGSEIEQNRSKWTGLAEEAADLRPHRIFPKEEHYKKYEQLRELKQRLKYAEEQADNINATPETKLFAEWSIRSLPEQIAKLKCDLEPERVWKHDSLNRTYSDHIRELILGEETFYSSDEFKKCLLYRRDLIHRPHPPEFFEEFEKDAVEAVTESQDRKALKQEIESEPEPQPKELRKRIVSEGRVLKKNNPLWTHDDIAEEITSNEEIKKRLQCGHLSKGTVKRYLRGQRIGKRGRPTK